MLTLMLAGRRRSSSDPWMFSCGSGSSALWVCLQVQLKRLPELGQQLPLCQEDSIRGTF